MTRKDYQLIADAMCSEIPEQRTAEWWTWWACCNALSAALQADNQRFDCDKFLTACKEGV